LVLRSYSISALDIGGDKQMRCLELSAEDNLFPGYREVYCTDVSDITEVGNIAAGAFVLPDEARHGKYYLPCWRTLNQDTGDT